MAKTKAKTKARKTTTTKTRHGELKTALEARRTALVDDLKSLKNDVRSQSRADRGPGDDQDGSDAGSGDDLHLALIQMKAEMLARIDVALGRLEAGNYGDCADCGEQIPSSRLRALPFAVRCKACQEAKEVQATHPTHAARRAYPSHVADAVE